MTLSGALRKVIFLARMTALTEEEREACTIVSNFLEAELSREQAFAFLKERKEKLEKKREARKAREIAEREEANA